MTFQLPVNPAVFLLHLCVRGINSKPPVQAGKGEIPVRSSDRCRCQSQVIFQCDSLVKQGGQVQCVMSARCLIQDINPVPRVVGCADRWTQVVDNSDADGGAWAMTGYSHGGYDDFSLNQSGLNVGFRQSAAGNAWWGMGAEFYRGHSSADGYRDDFSLWGVHVLAGKSFAGGLFVDGMTGYRELSEDYTIQGDLSDLSGRAKSHILTAGIRGGWKMHAAPLDMSITPTVSLNGARVDGNRLQGRERSVELHDGDALWLKAGVEAEKVSGNMTLKAGIWRNITLNDMPGMTLRDDWKARHYDAEKADRYTVSFGINGKLTEKLSVQAKVNSSFDGYFKTDAEGILGIRYDF